MLSHMQMKALECACGKWPLVMVLGSVTPVAV